MQNLSYTEQSLTAPLTTLPGTSTGEWRLLAPVAGYFGDEAEIFTDDAYVDLSAEHYFKTADKTELSDRMQRIFFGTVGRVVASHPESNVFFIGIDIGYRYLDVVYYHGVKKKSPQEKAVFVGYGLPMGDMVSPENAEILKSMLQGTHQIVFDGKPVIDVRILQVVIRSQPEMAIISQQLAFEQDILKVLPALMNNSGRPGGSLVLEIGSKTAHSGVYLLEHGKYTCHNPKYGDGLWSVQNRWVDLLTDALGSRFGAISPNEAMLLLERGMWKNVDLSRLKDQLAHESINKYIALANASWDKYISHSDTVGMVLFGRGVLLFKDLLFEHYKRICGVYQLKMILPENPGMAIAQGSALAAVSYWWKRRGEYFEVK